MGKQDELLSGHSREFIKSLKKNTGLMVKIYNNLCVSCKKTHLMREKRNLRTGYENYCRTCQDMIDNIGKEMK